jgi:DNA-binding IclR family transcriptional regulator
MKMRAKHDSNNRLPYVGRTIQVLEFIAWRPRTTAELAHKYRVSHRTITRFMQALAKEAPITIISQVAARRSERSAEWSLDVKAYVARFIKPKEGHSPKKGSV